MFFALLVEGVWGDGVWRSTKECVFDRGKPALSSKLLVLFLFYTKYNVD